MRKTKGINRTFTLDPGTVDVLDDWSDLTGVAKGVAAELGIWIVTHLPSLQREGLLALLRQGYGPIDPTDGSDFLCVGLDDCASDDMRRRWDDIVKTPIRYGRQPGASAGTAALKTRGDPDDVVDAAEATLRTRKKRTG